MTSKIFIGVILATAILGMIAIVVLNSLTTISVSYNYPSGTFRNVTINTLTETAKNFTTNQNAIAITNLIVTNFSGGELINAANYTVTGVNIASTLAATTSGFNNTKVNVSGSFAYTENSAIGNLTSNVTSGVSNFFSNSTTWFSLLAIVIIVAIVSVVIFFASKFTGSERGEPNLIAA